MPLRVAGGNVAPMIPHALEQLDDWRTMRREAGALFVGLDFDGTLSPIVQRPEDARLLPAAVVALRRLEARPDTHVAIVSGRGLSDVRDRVGLDGLYYAGNHGLEIEGPGVRRMHPEAEAAAPLLRSCARSLASALDGEPGVQLEDKGLTLSVHYRRARRAGAADRVLEAVSEACGGSLRTTVGKMVVEIRPAVAWDKGRAVVFLLEVVEGAHAGTVPALFVGDDRTDEDAFRVLVGRGAGVLVTEEPPGSTSALGYLRAPEEVVDLLEGLARDA